jgi:hypothetical protein
MSATLTADPATNKLLTDNQGNVLVNQKNLTKEFILAGDAIFTISNPSGTHFTFRVQQSEGNDRYGPATFVKLLTGPDNTSDYSYLGILEENNPVIVRLTGKSCAGEDAMSVKVIRWAMKLILSGRDLPAGYAVHHQGRCGRCARPLTVPESVERGIGPVCAKIMGIE